jgi:hypothetical protein
MNKLTDRPFHAFLSYSHKDSDIAFKLHHLLKEYAGFNIWIDTDHLEAGCPVEANIPEQMDKCRAWIGLASKNSVVPECWVKDECAQAAQCYKNNHDFRLIILRLDDCKVWRTVDWFNWIEMPGGVLTPNIVRDIIDRLDGRVWSGRQLGFRDIYVTRGWRTPDHSFADAVCKAFCDRKWRLRLIGDMPDQKHWNAVRIREILSSCSGHLVILPNRTPTEKEYKWILKELAISTKLAIPSLLLAETDADLPASLKTPVYRLVTGEEYLNSWSVTPPEWLEGFLEDLIEPQAPQHLFLAAEFKDNVERVAYLRDFVEAVTGLPCHIGRDFEGQALREQIISGLASASLVLANLGSFEGTLSGTPDLNFNTCVEAGIALGASSARQLAKKKPLPVLLTAQGRPDEKGKTARLPFMFRNSQITWYSSEAELLAHCHRLLQPYRRRIMNYEFMKPV